MVSQINAEMCAASLMVMYMWRLHCYWIRIAGGIFVEGKVVFAVVRVVSVRVVVGKKARSANDDFGVLALTWMRVLARRRAPSYSVDATRRKAKITIRKVWTSPDQGKTTE